MKNTLKVDLKNLIIAAGYNVSSFSDAVGVTRQNMHDIINNANEDILLSTARKIAKLLGKTIEDIWE